MTAYDIIEKKRFGKILSAEEIKFFIEGYTNGTIPDYQMSALLMAICIQGMNSDETFALTMTMLKSGDVVDMSRINGIVVDKHSTGGVGDSTTLALAPILACCGVSVAKMSGRGLGFTGGTIDKLESIPGFDTSLSEGEFFDVVNKVGCCVIGQTGNLCPADKKLYALRDVTATIDSIPLICGSIMSKKLASGADVVLLDVKYGNGAFMKTKEDALELSKAMVTIGTMAGKKFGALVTDMSQPLSNEIGNALEVIGAIKVLNGERSRLQEEIFEVAVNLLTLTGKFNPKQAEKAVADAVSSGKAKEKFKEMIASQHGDPSYVDNPEQFKLAKPYLIKSLSDGYVYSMDTAKIGRCLTTLGGGRILKTDNIDYSVGITMQKSIGDYVKKGETLATIYHNDKGLDETVSTLLDSIHISQTKPQKGNIAYAYVTSDGVKFF